MHEVRLRGKRAAGRSGGGDGTVVVEGDVARALLPVNLVDLTAVDHAVFGPDGPAEVTNLPGWLIRAGGARSRSKGKGGGGGGSGIGTGWQGSINYRRRKCCSRNVAANVGEAGSPAPVGAAASTTAAAATASRLLLLLAFRLQRQGRRAARAHQLNSLLANSTPQTQWLGVPTHTCSPHTEM